MQNARAFKHIASFSHPFDKIFVSEVETHTFHVFVDVHICTVCMCGCITIENVVVKLAIFHSDSESWKDSEGQNRQMKKLECFYLQTYKQFRYMPSICLNDSAAKLSLATQKLDQDHRNGLHSAGFFR